MSARVYDRTRWDRLQACCLLALFAIAPVLPIAAWVVIHLRFTVS
jgi:hypothetical protein